MTKNGEKIVLRADGNQEIGLGHLMRIKTLYDGLKLFNLNVNIVAVKNPYSEEVFKNLVDVIFLNESDKGLEKWPKSHLYIVDLYEYRDDFYERLKFSANNILILDDTEETLPKYIDGVINHNIYANANRYFGKLFKFCGPEYFLLRAEVRKFARTYNKGENVLVCMGGSDPEKQTAKMVQYLRKATNRTIDVVVAEKTREVQKLRKSYDGINVHERPNNIVEIMAKSKYALTGAGTMAYELAYLGIPTFLVVLAENQEKIAETFADQNIGINLGHYREIKESKIIENVQEFEHQINQLEKMAKNGQGIIDGQGPERLARDIVNAFELG